MKQVLRNILTLLTMLITFSVLTTGVVAASHGKVLDSGMCGDKATWSLYEDGLLEIGGEGAMEKYGQDDGNTPPWLKYNGKGLKSLVIKDGITTIGDCAFCACDSIKGSLVIPDSVKYIGYRSFYGCSGFDGTLTLGSGLKGIGSIPSNTPGWNSGGFGGSFMGCSGFTGDLIIPDNVVDLNGSNTFRDCSGFNGKLYISKNITALMGGNFWGCSGLTGDLNLPDGMLMIFDYAFNGCSGLSGQLRIPDKVKTIGSYTFADCSGFTGKISLPSSIENVRAHAFSGCYGITDLVLPEGFTGPRGSIPVYYAFYDMASLKTVVIPSTMTRLDKFLWAFHGCDSLTTVIFNGDAPTMNEYKPKDPIDSTFEAPRDTLTFYYKEGTSGWTTPTWKGYRCYPIGSNAAEETKTTSQTSGQGSGKVIGQVLSTDIRAYINGAEIPAYNIDGKLAIVVSDLNNYGFKTAYNNDLRKTSVTRDKTKTSFTSVPSKGSGQPIGTAVMNVLSSDITVELDGRKVEAFNVDNHMAIYFTELKGYGDYAYDNGSRTSKLALK